MIRFYRKTERTHLKELDSFEPGCWIYAEAPTVEETERLVHELGLDGGHISDAQDDDEMPRLEREDDQLYLFTRLPYTIEDHFQTTPVLFVIGKDFLLSLSNQPLPRIEKLLEGKVSWTSARPQSLALQLLNQLLDQYDTYLHQVGRQIKSIRARLRVEEISNRDFIDFLLVEDELNEVLSALTPTAAIFRRLLGNKHLQLHEADRELIEDLILASEQSIEVAKSSTKSIVNIREAYSTIMTNNLDRVIRVLTVVTVLLSVLTFMAGLYGMNIQLPFEDREHAFTFVLSLSLFIVAVLLWLFRKKRWL